MTRKVLSLDLSLPANTLIYGPTQSGKTVIIKNIVSKYKNYFDKILLFGSTANKVSFLNSKYCFDEIDTDFINKIRRVNQNNMEKILMIFDDVLDINFNGSDRLFWNGFLSSCRHENISTIFSLQYINGVNPTMRKNLKYIFVTDLDNRSIDDIFCYTYYEDKYELKQIRDELQGYECLFISRGKFDKAQEIVIADNI